MSRHTIPPLTAGIEVTIGWDNPMQTFFAQIDRVGADDDWDDPTLLWIGSHEGEIRRVEDLVQPLASYAELTEAHLTQLRTDRDADANRRPTTLQRQMLRLGR